MLQPNNIRMPILYQQPHNLQFPIFKPLILQHLFNRHNLPRFHHGGLEYHPKRSIPDDTFGGVGDGLIRRGGGGVVVGG